MKSAGETMLTQKGSSNAEDTHIQQVVETNRVSEDLLKGVVTQEVEDLRYRDYIVARESGRYVYDGNGGAIRKEDERDRHKVFSQANRLDVKGIVDGDSGDRNTYTLGVHYENIPRFRLESFCKMFDVNTINNHLKLRFSSFPDTYDYKSKGFINALEGVENIRTIHEIERNEICSNIKSLSFVTYKADGEDDLVRYTISDITYRSIEKTPFEYIITYDFGNFTREDIVLKYLSKNIATKYENKEERVKPAVGVYEYSQKYYCAECNKEVNNADAKITKATFGHPLCQECVGKLDNLIKEVKV